MDEQASVACATPSYHNRLRPTLDFSTKQPTTTFFVAYSLPQPPTPSPNTLFRPTLDCSAILPQPTAPFFVLHWPSYGSVPSHIVEKSSVGRRTTFFVLPLHWIGQPSYLIHPTLECSAILPHPTTTCVVLHWSVRPAYFMLPRPTTTFVHPTTSYTGECSSILPHPTATFFVLHWSVQPSSGIVL